MIKAENIFSILKDRHDYLYGLFVQHVYLSAVAIVIITVIGLGTGLGILQKPGLRRVVLGIVNFMYTIPSIAMFGLFIPLVGIGFTNALVVLVIYGLLPMIRNTCTGLSEVDPHLLDAAKAMGATPRQVFVRIRWPLAFPTILSGFRTMVVMTIALAGLASFIGAGGLGQAIYRGINTNNASLILIGSIAVAILALLTDLLIGSFEHSLKPGKPRTWRRYLKYGGLLLLAGMFIGPLFTTPAKRSGHEIVVASKPTAEQYILGEMIAQVIEENSNISVVRKFGIGGGTSNIHPAMLKGEADIYPEYTGTAWLFILKKTKVDNPDSLYARLKKIDDEKFDLEWICRLGFNNTFALALPETVASREHIRTISDLAAKSDRFRFGAEFDFFEREDGFKGLANVYPLHFKKQVELDVNLKFQALENNLVDVIDVFSTDSRIRQMNLRVLTDNRNFFPSYQAGIVVRGQTLREYPVLRKLLRQLDGLISDSTMQHLNYEVEIEKQSPARVARSFLEAKGMMGGDRKPETGERKRAER